MLNIYNHIKGQFNYSTPDLSIGMFNINGTNIDVRRILYSVTEGNTTVDKSFISRKNRTSNFVDRDGANAIIMIVDKNHASGRKIEHMTDKFLLHTIQQQKTEKVQLTETFDENNPAIFFFGKRTTPYSFTGTLLNATRESGTDTSINAAEWTAAFHNYWDNYLRGTKLAEQKKIAMMIVDNEVYEGYPINITFMKNSMSNHSAQFTMSWIITKHELLIDRKILEEISFFKDDQDLVKLFEKMQTLYPLFTAYTTLVGLIDKKIQVTANPLPFTLSSGKSLVATINFKDKELYDKGVIVLKEVSGSSNFGKLTMNYYVDANTFNSLEYEFSKDCKDALKHVATLLKNNSTTAKDALTYSIDSLVQFDNLASTYSMGEVEYTSVIEGASRFTVELEQLKDEYNTLIQELEKDV